ncbi:MAG: type II toxin-antitoxin system Phd/YefM family antitoxin [Deltaproteobacteria bacterium]|jgi:prevent-host-death family protein|nr:type II toxin-antitoxin system Phd/YefM family antitoxin [Deltaproteobacteria bacterium]
MNLQNIQPLSYFRANAHAVMKDIRETGTPVILTQNGLAAGVVVSPQEWEAVQESLAMLRLVAIRRQEVNDGRTIDFDEGMSKIDALIEGHDGK